MQDRSYSQTERFSHYAMSDFAANPNVEGVSVYFKWTQLEGHTRGDYRAGFALIRAELDKLASLPTPKRLILRVMDKRYASDVTMASANQWFPQYMVDASYVYVSDSRDLLWKRWDATAMGYFIDLWKAYGKEFDGHPNLEMVSPWPESAINVKNPSPSTATTGYSESAVLTQYKRLAQAMRAAFPTTNIWMSVNWEPYSVAAQTEFYSYLETIGAGSGNPDTLDTYSNGLQGMRPDTILRGAQPGSRDFRGRIPIVYAVEDSSLGYNAVGDLTAQQAYDYVNNVQRTNYYLWDRNTHVGTDAQRWYANGTTQPGGILRVISSQPLTHRSKPSSLD